MIVRTKPGVRFATFTPDLVEILGALVRLAAHPLLPSEGLVITSGSDGQHLANSKHYTGQAVDVRSRSFATANKVAFTSVLRDTLGPRFTVLLEHEGLAQEHWHIQTRKTA